MKGLPQVKCISCLLLMMLFRSSFVFGQVQQKPSLTETSHAVPLIDRELFFDNPEISNGQLSPDGHLIAFLKAYKGVMNIWVKKTDEPTSKARPVTSSEEPLGNYFWTADSKYILFAHNIWNNENYNIYTIDPQDSTDAGITTVRNLTPMDTSSAVIYAASTKNPDLLWIGMNKRDPRWYDLYTLQISTGAVNLVRKNSDKVSEIIFDWDEQPRLAIRHLATDSSTEILRLNKDGSSTKVYDCSVLEKCRPLKFTNDNQHFYLETNKGENQNLVKLLLVNPETMKSQDLEQDPLNKVDLENTLFSHQTHQLLSTTYVDDRTRIYWKDTSFQADYFFLQKKFPGRNVDFSNASADDQQWLITISSDDKLSQVYLFHRGTKQLVLQYTPQNGLRQYENYFSRTQPFTYQSSDELSIPAYLSLPKGQPAKNLPLIVYPHPGPWSRDERGFNNLVQWLNNRGYAVLQMNYRGSDGFGKKFLNAGNKQWGLLMQDDITWGVNDLIGKGIADPKRIGIIGNNYGGYAVLAGLTFTSDIYAAAVDINGPANLISFSNAIPPGWTGTRKIFKERVGDSSTTTGKNLLRKQSPLNTDSVIRTPLMIVHGMNDPFVKKTENDQIVVALRDSGRKIEYISLPGEGYPFVNPLNGAAVFARVEAFLGKYLHGRFQESMRSDLAKRAKEITVDVETVTLGVAIPVSPVEEFAAPSIDLAAGNYTYSLLVELPGRKVPLAMIRSITGDSLSWIVTDRILGQAGDQADEATYQKGSLRLISRKTLQKSTVTEYSFLGKEVTTSTGDKTTSETVDGAYLHDGAGIDLLIARMPLREGYITGFYLVGDDGKAKLYQLRVTGRDTINNESCLKVELTNAENTAISTKLWINMAHKMAYRMIVPLASFAGAKMTIELRQQPGLPKFLLFLWSITPAHGM
jgi:dipeptidyl aminopeptidase/acylaminoacyl peptidase